MWVWSAMLPRIFSIHRFLYKVSLSDCIIVRKLNKCRKWDNNEFQPGEQEFWEWGRHRRIISSIKYEIHKDNKGGLCLYAHLHQATEKYSHLSSTSKTSCSCFGNAEQLTDQSSPLQLSDPVHEIAPKSWTFISCNTNKSCDSTSNKVKKERSHRETRHRGLLVGKRLWDYRVRKTHLKSQFFWGCSTSLENSTKQMRRRLNT